MGKRKLLSVLLCCTALAACGGGGNIQENLAAANGGDSPPPAADPSDDFETGEYLANWGLGAVNPIPAWEAGITGQGVVVAVIDSGIDDAHADLDGNIHPDSNYTGDIGGQGTFIAGIIASEKEGNGTHGIAFESQILAIQSASTNAGIASAIDYAVAHEADVINISIDGGAPDATILTALQNAAQAGIIVIFNAGDADFSYDASVSLPPSAPTPKLLAMVATEALANGQFLIVGTMDKDREAHYDDFDRDPDNAPADPDWHDVSGTNIAGEIGAEYYVLAPGQEIFSTRAGGSDLYEFRGGSAYAAPVVAAAVALLKQSFPSLTADEIVTILTKTADDVVSYSGIDGSNNLPGADEINGHGIINIGAALSPIGTNSLAIKTQGGWIKTDLEDAGLVSGGVFGDGVGNGFASGAIFLDDFDRAYRTSFSNQIITANPFINFDSRFTNVRDYRQASIALSPDFHVSFAANYSVAGSPYEQNLPGLREDDTGLAENVNIRLTKGVGKSSAVSMSVGGSLAGVMSFGRPDTGFAHATNLSAGMSDPWISSGRSSHYGDGQRIGFIHNLNDTMTLSVGISSDLVATPNYENLSEHDPEASRKIIVSQLQGGKGRLGWKTLLGIVNEEGMVLDSHSTGALRLGKGADTAFYAIGAEYALTDRIRAFGRIGQSFTDVDESAMSAFSRFDTLEASHFAAGINIARAFSPVGALSLSVSQPLRLERGAASLNIASSYDYTTETPNFNNKTNSLTPSGRELDFEAAYRYGLGNSAVLSANLLYQSQPGHIAGAEGVLSFMVSARSTF